MDESKRRLEDKELQELIAYYRTGKKMFWVIISLGMLAGAVTAIIVLFKQFKS